MQRRESCRSGDSCKPAATPADDKFLDVAVNGGAAVIVSGNSDLLVLGSIERIPIVTPADYLARY